MKVRELIEWLECFDGDKELMMEQNGGEYVSDLEFIDIQEKDGKVWIYD
jgi:hypothetical protein